ncbi:MAG TPA: hypothetical protein VK541_17155 [Pedobacter sp.]|uniref:bestrophin-like domain n=1 Tax=Pedobacter sp. TaxID=1411316 RepID=UPI002CD57F32|nr:hypothetical protein [Pedobacter sp.]HMI04220.1 hypothetical protein [Pedobacter sp.]
MNSILFHTPAILICGILFILMIAFNRLGFYILQRANQEDSNAAESLGAIEGSLLGLLALLLSFTFSMSASKSDTRRQIIVQEANDIGTAILRCDLYPDSTRSKLKPLFDDYLNARISYYEAGIDENQLNQSLQQSNDYSGKIWKSVTALSQNKDNAFRSQQMIPALNAMMDIATTRDADRNAHVPESIYWLLFLLTITGSFIVGYGTKGKRFNWIIVCGFTLMTVMTIYLILDLDRPRRGIINMDQTHQKIVELKSLVKTQ